MWWKAEKCWLNSETVMVEPWNSDSGTVWVEQCGWKSVVKQFWRNSGTVMLEQCTWNSDGGTLRCNSVGEREWWNRVGGTKWVEH